MTPYLPYLLALLAALLLGWLAWRRPDRRRLVWRLLASTVAGISLVLLLFPPTYQRALDPGTAILLTQGYSADTLENLLASLEPKPIVYTYHTKAPSSVAIPDLYTFRQKQPQLQTVHVLGYGLAEQELEAMQGLQLVPHLSDMPAGIASITWSEQVSLGEAVQAAGGEIVRPVPSRRIVFGGTIGLVGRATWAMLTGVQYAPCSKTMLAPAGKRCPSAWCSGMLMSTGASVPRYTTGLLAS